ESDAGYDVRLHDACKYLHIIGHRRGECKYLLARKRTGPRNARGMIDRAELTLIANAAGLGGATVYLAGLWPERGRVALDDGREICPASMIKTPLAAAVAMAVSRRELTFEDRVRVTEANMTPNDAPSPLEPGVVAGVGDLVGLMLQHSDNVATNML